MAAGLVGRLLAALAMYAAWAFELVEAEHVLVGVVVAGLEDVLDGQLGKVRVGVGREVGHDRLDFDEPIALMLLGILGHIEDDDGVARKP